jgi:hypothetical protein
MGPKMSGNVVLGRNQKRALAALLSLRSLTEAAKECRLSIKTMQRYLENPAFRAALAEAEGDLIDTAARRLTTLAEPAIRVITVTMANDAVPAGVRLSAAKAVLDYLLRLRELCHVEERLTKLEEVTYGKQKHRDDDIGDL